MIILFLFLKEWSLLSLFQFWNLYFMMSSGFQDLFDWQYFIESLRDDVHIIDSLPSEYAGIEPFLKTPISWSKVCMRDVAAVFCIDSWFRLKRWGEVYNRTLHTNELHCFWKVQMFMYTYIIGKRYTHAS